MNGIIYHAFDTSNGLPYVGQTWRSLEVRKICHQKYDKKYYFGKAFSKRPSDFVWNILTSGLQTQKELDEAELYFGKFFDCLYPNGYNHRLGGARGFASNETKAKISAKASGRKIGPPSAETRAKISAAKKGMLKTDEHKIKLSVSKIGKKLTPEHRASISRGWDKRRLRFLS